MAGKVRVHELAKELGVTAKQLLLWAAEQGEFARSASSTLPAPVARRLRETYAGHSNRAARPDQSKPLAVNARGENTKPQKSAAKSVSGGKAKPKKAAGGDGKQMGHRVSGVLCHGCGKAACAGNLVKYRKLELDRATPKRKGTCHACKAKVVNVRRYRAVRERERPISYAVMMRTNSVPPGRGGYCG
jgi:hypothetical protein